MSLASTTQHEGVGVATGPSSSRQSAPKPHLGRRRRKADSPSQTHWGAIRAAEQSATLPLEVRMQLLQQHGDFSLAYSTATQALLEYFGDGAGYLAYRQRWGQVFALADPVCGEERRAGLIEEFLARHPKAIFAQCSAATARILEGHGYRINEIGFDTRLDLADWSFAGKQREWLRYADNWVSRRGYQIREGSFVEHREQVEAVSEAWRETRRVKRKEVRFLNRPIMLEDEPGVRRFLMFDESGSLQAFVVFDPLYRDGKVSGYVTCLKRRMPELAQYGEPAIMKRAIETFQREGVPAVWLGLSPLAGIEDRQFRANRLLHRTFRYYHGAGWINRWFYNFVGHTQYKKRFRGEEQQYYFASRHFWNTRSLLGLCSLCGVI